MFSKKAKILCLAILMLTLLLVFVAQVRAEVNYDSKASFEITVQEDNSYKVVQRLNMKNLSEQFLLSGTEFKYPFQPLNPQANLNGQPVQVILTGKTLQVDFSDQVVFPQKEAILTVEFVLKDLSYQVGSVRRFSWPEIDFHRGGYDVKFKIPIEFGEISYISQDVKTNSNSGYYEIEFYSEEEIMITAGKLENLSLTINWKVQELAGTLTRVPLPGGIDQVFTYEEFTSLEKGERDKMGNEYLLVSANVPKGGVLKGKLSPASKEVPLQSKKNKFFSDIGGLDLEDNSDPKIIYTKILEKLSPNTAEGELTRLPIDQILTTEQNSALAYADLLATALREHGYNAEVVYGIVTWPGTTQNNWHFWVIYKEQGGEIWNPLDPYMQDLFGYNFYNQVDPLRIQWGILPDEAHIGDLGIQNIIDLNKIWEPEKSDQVLGVNVNYDLFVDLPNEIYSGQVVPIELIIHNYSNRNLYLEEIKLQNIKIADAEIDKYLIVPNGVEIIKISSLIVSNPLSQGRQNVNGYVKVNIGGTERIIEINKEIKVYINYEVLIVNSLIVFGSVFLVSLYLRRNMKLDQQS